MSRNQLEIGEALFDEREAPMGEALTHDSKHGLRDRENVLGHRETFLHRREDVLRAGDHLFRHRDHFSLNRNTFLRSGPHLLRT